MFTKKEINGANKIQKWYRERELKKSTIKLKDSFNDLYCGIVDNYTKYTEINNITLLETDFDVFTKILIDKMTILLVDNFVQKYYKLVKFDPVISKRINSRKLLSSFMIYGFPEILMDTSRNNLNGLESDLTHYSKKLMDNLHKYINNKVCTNEDLRKLIKSMNMYSNSFDLFLHKDKIKLINKTTMEWYQISKTIDEIKVSNKYDESGENSKEKIISNLVKTLENLEEMLLMINPKFKMENLTVFKKITDNYDKTLKKAFWDLFKLDLSNDNKSERDEIIKKQVMTILLDLRALCKSTKYKNLEDNIISYLDNSYLEQLCENSLNTFVLWVEFGEFLTETILSIHSMDRDTDTIIRWNLIKNSNYNNLNDLIFEIIKYSNEELTNIFSDIYNLALMASLNINPLLKK